MSRFRNNATGVVVSVADEKDSRFVDGWVSADVAEKRVVVRPKKDAPKAE